MRDHPRRSPARYLAPIALVVVGVAFYVVLTSVNQGTPDGTSKRPTGEQTTTDPATTATTTAKPLRRFYRVRAGDTLPVIAERTGVSQDRIVTLNPDLDPATLQIGQRIKLRE